MGRFAHHNPEDPEAAMEALVDRADFAKTQQREAAFGSFEWAKQIVAPLERRIMSEPGLPQLDEPTRSRERAALDIAIKGLFGQLTPSEALDKIAALVPDAVP